MKHSEIRKIRETLQLTQEQLADALDVTKGAVSQWEGGSKEPSIENGRKLVAYARRRGYPLTLDKLFGVDPIAEPWTDKAA